MDFRELLRCPSCAGEFTVGTALLCAACGAEYPHVGGIPWLFENPESVRGEWRARAGALIAALESQAARYRSALTESVTSARAHRLKLLAAA
jgi:uncharacterized protein YbaR (Trm112 family)